jgi:hypothetical protein
MRLYVSDGPNPMAGLHSALTTGFDAPATDLIVIARPVFSPSLYMQMVGRGMRGPINGATGQDKDITICERIPLSLRIATAHDATQLWLGGSVISVPMR